MGRDGDDGGVVGDGVGAVWGGMRVVSRRGTLFVSDGGDLPDGGSECPRGALWVGGDERGIGGGRLWVEGGMKEVSGGGGWH